MSIIHIFLKSVFAMFLTATVLCQITLAAEKADKIFVNGRVFTADDQNSYVEAIAVKGDRILATGTTAAISRLRNTQTVTIDLKKRLVIPGINDAHYHMFSNAPVGYQLQLDWEPGWDDVARELKKAVLELPKGAWITGLIGVNAIEDEARAKRFFLDNITPDHPVYISTWFSHGEVFNTAAMRALGVKENEPDPIGGWFDRVEGSQVITGRFYEYAQWPLRRKLIDLTLTDEQIKDEFEKEAMKLLSLGVTSVQDMPIMKPERYLKLLNKSDFPIRVRYMRIPVTTPEGRDTDEARDIPTHPFDNPMITATGTKWFMDGTPIERGAALRKDYADKPGWKGYLAFPKEEVTDILTNRNDWKGQLLFHCHGDAAAENLFNRMKSIKDVNWASQRVRVEHGDGVVGELAKTASELGVIVVQQPAHLVIGYIYQARYGYDTKFFPLKSLIDEGVVLAFGTEGLESPFEHIGHAVNHNMNPAESITREQAVKAFTRDSAYAEFEEKDKGIIAQGMLADFAVLSQNIFSVPVEKIRETQSVMTVIGGEIKYSLEGNNK